MKETITFEDLVEMSFFEGLAAVSLIARGDLKLKIGDRYARQPQIEKMVGDLVRIMAGKEPVLAMN